MNTFNFTTNNAF
uniref:Uncharacterized protein n=1 Tax=Anguilla anguilla TaxID=7936 RepID=A0A0E9V873_ANGAN